MTLIRYSNLPRLSRLVPAYGRSPWNGLENQIDRLFDSALSDFASPNAAHCEERLAEGQQNRPVDGFE